MKTIKLYFIILLLGIVNYSFAQFFDESAFKLSRAINLIDSYYVDSVNKDKLVENAIRDVLKELDPHSTYLTKEEVKEMSEPLQGSFEGIGIEFNVLDDTILIISPMSGGPSEKVGIFSGDRIIKIEEENVAGTGITSQQVRERLLGKKGTKVTVSIMRRGVNGLIDFEITRDNIPIYSLDAAYMATKDIGYIKLNRFSLTTIDEFNQALTKLREQNMKDLILDLQDNTGGYLHIAVELADAFLPDKKLIVYTEGLKNPKKEYYSTAQGGFENGHFVVLINEGSASASEILAGAIQDWDRGIIIGRRSFGKGLVQNPLMLSDGSMLRLTVARYHTPTGRVIQKPYKGKAEEYEKDLLERYERGEYTSKDSIHFTDSLKYYTLKNKRLVYGGGGIMPDIFTPLDTNSFSDYYMNLRRKGTINNFSLTYVDNNRQRLTAKYKNIAEFKTNFEVTDKIVSELVKEAEKAGIKKDEQGLKTSIDTLRTQLKALIARDIWDSSEFFEIINEINPGFSKAVEVLGDWENYSHTILKD